MSHNTDDITSMHEPFFVLDRREHPRIPTQARFMVRAGMGRHSPAGYGTVTDISESGLRLVPDPVVFSSHRDFWPRTTVIMLGFDEWCRRFYLSGTVVRVDKDGSVGIRINSTTSAAFFHEWLAKGTPGPR